jgi:hypothetical protein
MSVGLMQRLRGDGYLAWRAVFVQPLLRLFRKDEGSGVQRFLANYGPEGLVPMTEDDRAVLRGAARCIGCGLCDVYEPWASALPLALSRATPELPHAEGTLAAFSESGLEAGERACPTRVPLVRIREYLLAKLSRVARVPPHDSSSGGEAP